MYVYKQTGGARNLMPSLVPAMTSEESLLKALLTTVAEKRKAITAAAT